MAKYLVEIGTEELPYKFIPSAEKQLKEFFEKALEENRIEYKNVDTYGTPRRLAVIINQISLTQPDMKKIIKGPPAKIAFDENGNLTKAGEGFAKKQNIPAENIYKENVDGVDYLFAKIEEKGQPTRELLKILVPELILKLQGSHFMRWGDFDTKFSRPIRWIVSLLDNEEIKISIENIISSNYSKGHRFTENNSVKIHSPETYLDDLYKANVIVDTKKRKQKVIEEAKKVAEKINGEVYLSDDLVDEVSYINEWPIGVLGEFSQEYLKVPQEVIITVMASHQRYFPVFEKETKNLKNCFVTMANYTGTEFENIKKGNERVVKARLDDAIFFYNEDTKTKLETKIPKLKGITFQKGLGTVGDKVERIKTLAEYISEETKLSFSDKTNVKRTAELAKADWVTNLVFEFTELEGIIGSKYAKIDNETEDVCKGIKEHYMPLSADGELANTITGQIVGIADKTDTICSVFAIGKIPTGSADPLGLRRASLGILLTIINKNIQIDLSKLIEKSINTLPAEVKIENKQKLQEQIETFIIQRLKNYYNDKYRYDVIDAVFEAKNPLINLHDTICRLEILAKIVEKDNYSSIHESANRISRLIKNQEISNTPDDSLFVQDIERQLSNCIKSIDETKLSYSKLVQKLEDAVPIIEKFFDDVLVMDKDEKIKNNRIALLGSIQQKFLKIADFSKIVY
ncbi:MAG: glycine--tRNA ligase subunit beta [Candidatus Gastranaerophilales bacterium]|nr:glycine--tRNA ligase subunit beta [Candidatus Gastranaerophilales bacterium]